MPRRDADRYQLPQETDRLPPTGFNQMVAEHAGTRSGGTAFDKSDGFGVKHDPSVPIGTKTLEWAHRAKSTR